MTDTPRIVLPPGVEEPDPDLPPFPKIRPLEMVPVRDGENDYLVITDPTGVIPAPVALRLEALEMIQILDGNVSLDDLAALMARESQDIRAARFVRDFVGQLDRLLLLDSPRFQRALAEARDAYHPLEIRPAALEGISYPADPGEAEAFVAGHVEEARVLRAARAEATPDGTATYGHAGSDRAAASAPHAPADTPIPVPRALMVPHLDPRRAGPSIALGYLELDRTEAGASTGEVVPRPLRIVVFGVGHSLLGEPFALTRKHFETPFGRLPCDTAFVDQVASRLGEAAYRGELAHRDEHSIEIQALYLRRAFRDRPISLVPILCGGFHELAEHERSPRDSDFEALIEAVRATERALGGDTLYVAAVDLSHVGARFGDPAPDERTLSEIEALDRSALDAARRGDADGWYQAIAAHRDSTRICGWGATYVMLRAAEPGEGRLLRYEQSQESGGSMVSIATMAWP